MREPEPIVVIDLFPETLDALVALLAELSPEDWARSTVCSRWSVKDITVHLLGGDISLLSRKRDAEQSSGEPVKSWTELVALINKLNDTWVKAARRISPRLLCDLLRFTGRRSANTSAPSTPRRWEAP